MNLEEISKAYYVNNLSVVVILQIDKKESFTQSKLNSSKDCSLGIQKMAIKPQSSFGGIYAGSSVLQTQTIKCLF